MASREHLAIEGRFSTLMILALQFCLPSSAIGQTPTLHVESTLTLVDVIAEVTDKTHTHRQVIGGFSRDDFRIKDDGKEVPVATFDQGQNARPATYWFLVQCRDDQPESKHSAFIAGKEQKLLPALQQLGATGNVAAAHWCDDGVVAVDVWPQHDPGLVIDAVAKIMRRPPVEANVRPGELLLQQLFRNVLQNTAKSVPGSLPVLIFLHGDGAATDSLEAQGIENALLSSSAIVFGVNDGRWPVLLKKNILLDGSTRQFNLIHAYARATGGEVYSVSRPADYSKAVEYIGAQMSQRCTLGFRPRVFDGKRHTISVELTDAAKKRLGSVSLRFRTEYVPK